MNTIKFCHLVRKILNDDICDALKGYFLLQDHNRNTRDNNNAIILPPLKLNMRGAGSFIWERNYKTNL